MRIPLKKVYRAFSELDRFDDNQCELLMRRVHLELGATSLIWSFSLGGVGLSLVLVLTAWAATDFSQLARQLFRDVDILFGLLSVCIIPVAVGFLTRDVLLHRFLTRAIRLRIDRVRCRQCKYVLIGQRPTGDSVTCPECGSENLLRALGVAKDDLVPPASDLEPLSSEIRPTK